MPLRTARGLQSLDSGKLGTNFRTADPADCVFVVRLIFLWCASINDCWLDFFFRLLPTSGVWLWPGPGPGRVAGEPGRAALIVEKESGDQQSVRLSW